MRRPRHQLVGPWRENVPTLTVEFYEKWYELWLVHIDGTKTSVSFGALEHIAAEFNVSAFCDHGPNPFVVEEYAVHKGYYLPLLAYELMCGRWVLYHDDQEPGAP